MKQNDDPEGKHYDPELDIEHIFDYDDKTWYSWVYKWTIGMALPKETIVQPSMQDVTESAAIYRIKRSFERGKQKEKIKPMNKDHWFAKSKLWAEPDTSFLNEAYSNLKLF